VTLKNLSIDARKRAMTALRDAVADQPLTDNEVPGGGETLTLESLTGVVAVHDGLFYFDEEGQLVTFVVARTDKRTGDTIWRGADGTAWYTQSYAVLAFMAAVIADEKKRGGQL
jgi:hypothetical protein